MSTTFAQLTGRLLADLGDAVEFVDQTEALDALVLHHSIRVAQARWSSVNVLLATTAEFTITDADPYDITSLVGQGVPLWVEYQLQDEIDWMPIRIVGLRQLEEYRMMGALACAFEGVEPADAADPVTQQIYFTFIPSGPVRIRFSRDTESFAMANAIELPDNVANLIVFEAEIDLIPKIQTAIAFRMRRDEELRSIGPAIVAALTLKAKRLEENIVQLLSIWEAWAFRARSTNQNFKKPTPSGRGLYGGRYLGGQGPNQ